MIKLFLSFILLFLTGQAHAISPENGWWWNPNASGTGYNIEIQDNILAVSTYVFDPAGAPFYYISAGLMSNDKSYTGSLDLVSGGQCIGCPYKAPTRATVGTLSLYFSSPTNATLSINGGATIPIERLAFGINTAAPYKMLGEWAFIDGSSLFPVYFGERIKFNSTSTSTDGSLFAAGSRSGSSSNTAVSSITSSGKWSLLLDSSSSYYKYCTYTFTGLNTIEGTSWTFLKSSAPTGSGLPFIAFRSQSASFVKNGIGPGMQGRSSSHIDILMPEMELRDEMQYLRSSESSSVVDPEVAIDVQKAIHLLRGSSLAVQ